jgi:hypothetical protein
MVEMVPPDGHILFSTFTVTVTAHPIHFIMDTLDIMNSPAQDLSTERPTENTNIPAPFKPKKHRRSRHDPEPDWSAQMREKISKSHRRMGHACDRCKVCSRTFLVQSSIIAIPAC